MPEDHDPTGAAALSICESLLLCLVDRGLLTEDEVAGLLDDAATAHLVTGLPPEDTARGLETAALIARIAVGNNVPRRRTRKPASDHH